MVNIELCTESVLLISFVEINSSCLITIFKESRNGYKTFDVCHRRNLRWFSTLLPVTNTVGHSMIITFCDTWQGSSVSCYIATGVGSFILLLIFGGKSKKRSPQQFPKSAIGSITYCVSGVYIYLIFILLSTRRYNYNITVIRHLIFLSYSNHNISLYSTRN